ncbi:MAG: DUF3572 domain-containing protein [Hyphomicrobiales bacterium]
MIHRSADLLRKGKYLAPKKRAPVTRKVAETLAIQALTFIAGDGERLGAFLAMSGIGPDQIRAAAREPGFLAAVLDHVLADQKALADFAEGAGVTPAHVAKAREALAGPGWEREVP